MDLSELEGKIVSTFLRFNPLRVILFGSFAADRADEESDIDLIIVYRTDKKFLDRLRELYMVWDIPRAVDILAYTPEEFDHMAANSSFLQDALGTGRIIYEDTGERSPSVVSASGR